MCCNWPDLRTHAVPICANTHEIENMKADMEDTQNMQIPVSPDFPQKHGSMLIEAFQRFLSQPHRVHKSSSGPLFFLSPVQATLCLTLSHTVYQDVTYHLKKMLSAASDHSYFAESVEYICGDHWPVQSYVGG